MPLFRWYLFLFFTSIENVKSVNGEEETESGFKQNLALDSILWINFFEKLLNEGLLTTKHTFIFALKCL